MWSQNKVLLTTVTWSAAGNQKQIASEECKKKAVIHSPFPQGSASST